MPQTGEVRLATVAITEDNSVEIAVWVQWCIDHDQYVPACLVELAAALAEEFHDEEPGEDPDPPGVGGAVWRNGKQPR